MKKQFKKKIVSAVTTLLALSLLISTVWAVGAGERVYRTSRDITNNLKYVNTIALNDTYGREESYALEYTPGGDVRPIVIACDTLYGTLTERSVISYAEGLGYNVVGAVNSDFFSLTTGVPMGIVIENGVYKCSPSGFNAVGFTDSGEFIFSENVQVQISLYNNGGGAGDNAGKSTSLVNFNKYRTSPGGLYLYSEYFSTVSTRTYTDGWFVKFRVLDGGQMRVNGTLELEVVDTLQSDEAIQIGEGYMVLSAAADSGRGDEFTKYSVGDRVTLTTSCSDDRLSNVSWATGSGNLLVRDGAMTNSDYWTDPAGQNPRTAIGVRPDGTIITYVIDGRDADHSNGLRLSDLAEELMQDGCTYVVNLDGGGSSAISARLPGDRECSLLNSPSDGEQRGCSTYILFVTSSSSNSVPENLYINQDGAVVLRGSQLELSYKATDGGYMPVSVPGDVRAAADNGSISGNTYTASVSGTEHISLYSPSTGAEGRGELAVVNSLSSLTVTRGGDKVSSITASPGERVQLSCSATYNQRRVESSPEAYTYEVSGNIGSVNSSGVFIASTSGGGNGTITVSAGGLSQRIDVRVTATFSDIVGHWGQREIEKLYSLGIINGVSATSFAPDNNIRRCDFVLMLYRAAGEPEAAVSDSFSDVRADAYYAKAVSWAVDNKIAQGYGNGMFHPEQTINREQAFTFVYRALDILGIDSRDGDVSLLSGFDDVSLLSQFAIIPAATLVELGVVQGDGTSLSPRADLTRAQTAKIIGVVLDLV